MKKEYIVYFDTKFYVQLCRANEPEADRIVSSLNALNVRHVISNVLIRELLTSKHRSDLDRVLVQRVRQLKAPPYRAECDAEWEVLLLSGEERIFVADRFREIHDELTVATSNSIVARRDMTPEKIAEYLKASHPLLQKYGFPEDFQKDIAQVISATKGILDSLGMSDQIEWPENPTAADCLDLSEQIKGILDPSEIAILEEHHRIQDSSTQSENRPYQVAIGTASAKSAKSLSNTLRDTEHIILFVQHQNEIDLLQVDKPHHAIINRAQPKHRLAELGLAHRCFCADSLSEAVAKVRHLIPSQSDSGS